MPTRPCIAPGCPNLTRGTRCPAHQRAHDAQRWQAKAGRYNNGWRAHSKQAIANHLATHGPVCPGWHDHKPHPVNPADLVCDHDEGVMCRAANAIKAATVDKQRVGGRSNL